MTSENFSRGQAFLAQGTDHFLNKMLSIRKVRLLITSRYIAMQSYECVIISKMFLIYFISYGCNGGALVFLRGAEASASPSFALPMFITIKKIIILHLFLGVPAATVGGTGTPWHTRGYAPDGQCTLMKIWQVNVPELARRLCFISNIAISHVGNIVFTSWTPPQSWNYEREILIWAHSFNIGKYQWENRCSVYIEDKCIQINKKHYYSFHLR